MYKTEHRYCELETEEEWKVFELASDIAETDYETYIEEALKKYIDVAEELDYVLRNEFKDYKLDFFKYLEMNLNRDYKLSDKIDDFLLEKEEPYEKIKFRTIDNELIPIEKYDTTMKKAVEMYNDKVDKCFDDLLKRKVLRVSNCFSILTYSRQNELTNGEKYTFKGAIPVIDVAKYLDDLLAVEDKIDSECVSVRCYPCIAGEYRFDEMEIPKDMYLEQAKENDFDVEYLGKISLIEAVEKVQSYSESYLYGEKITTLKVKFCSNREYPMGEFDEDGMDCIDLLDWVKTVGICKEEKSKSKGWCY